MSKKHEPGTGNLKPQTWNYLTISTEQCAPLSTRSVVLPLSICSREEAPGSP